MLLEPLNLSFRNGTIKLKELYASRSSFLTRFCSWEAKFLFSAESHLKRSPFELFSNWGVFKDLSVALSVPSFDFPDGTGHLRPWLTLFVDTGYTESDLKWTVGVFVWKEVFARVPVTGDGALCYEWVIVHELVGTQHDECNDEKHDKDRDTSPSTRPVVRPPRRQYKIYFLRKEISEAVEGTLTAVLAATLAWFALYSHTTAHFSILFLINCIKSNL